MKSILALSPHADDAELGLGGHMHRLRRGHPDCQIEIGVMAYGDNSSSKDEQNANQRLQEAQAAAEHLGAKLVMLQAAPDGAFNTVAHGKLVRAVEDFLFAGRKHSPDAFYIPLPSFHGDHTATYHAAISALRPRLDRTVPRCVYAYEYPGHHWGPQVPSLGKVYRTVTGFDIAKKLKTLGCYGSQWVSVPNAPGLGGDAVETLAKLRGSEVNAEYAELFYSIREID